jgi:regulator of replication initiation timing
MTKVEDLQREIERLQEAKWRALSLADERAKEAAGLRLENDRLRARLTGCDRS